MSQIPSLALVSGGLDRQARFLPNQQLIADLLKSTNGHALESINNAINLLPIRTDWHPKESTECVKAIRTLTYFARESVIAANLYTRDLCTTTESLGLPEARTAALRNAQAHKFQMAYASQAAELGIYSLALGDERNPQNSPEQVRYGLDKFSQVDVGEQEGDYAFEYVTRVPEWYQIMLSPSTTGFLSLLQVSGRAVYVTSPASYPE